MNAEEGITDAEVVVEGVATPASNTELATHTAFAVTTPVKASDLVDRLDKIREAMDNAMQEDVDYGKIPGTDKPTLLKPGAEKLAVMFRLDVQTTHDEKWGPGDHLTVPAYTVIYDAPTGTRLGRGEGMCSTREHKYAYRKQERACPSCSKATVFRSKKEGEGWYCWAKKGGCGAQFPVDDARITSQATDEIDNPDLPDLWNTIIKMARKRAIVDAVLLVTGASALFTQDVEDLPIADAPVTTGMAQGPPYGPPVRDAQLEIGRKAIAYLLRVETGDAQVDEVCVWLATDTGGYLPACTMRGLTHVAKRAKDANPEEPSAEVRDAELLAAESDAFAEELTKPLGVDDAG